MLRNNAKSINRMHILLDALIVIAIYAVSYYARFKWLTCFKFFALSETEKYLTFKQCAKWLIAIVPGYAFIFSSVNLYESKRGKKRSAEAWDVIKANFLGMLLLLSVLYIFKEVNLSRKYIAVFVTLNTLVDIVYRVVLRRILSLSRKKGKNLRHVLIAGYSRTTENYIDRVVANPGWGYRIAGILDDKLELHTRYKGVEVVGKLEELNERLSDNDYDEVVVALAIEDYAILKDIVSVCEKHGAHTKFLPDYMDVVPTVPDIEDIEGLTAISIRKVPLAVLSNAFIKRLSDFILSLLGIIVTGIPMLIVAVIIKCTSKGPVFYKQERVGYRNKTFRMLKFRSMRVQDEEEEKKAWTKPGDPRITGIGKFIRKTSIDELPQLFNVLKGDMSLIGPRPERPQFVDKFKEDIPRYMVKHQVRPGITGWAQVNGFRGDTSIRKRIEYDLYYIENWSVGLDIKIIFMTIFKGVISKDAY